MNGSTFGSATSLPRAIRSHDCWRLCTLGIDKNPLVEAGTNYSADFVAGGACWQKAADAHSKTTKKETEETKFPI